MKREKFKELVKETRCLAFTKMIQLKDIQSKMKNLNYLELKMQNYLMCNDISVNQARLIFRTRCRMTTYWNNFKGHNLTQICPVCKEGDTVDDQRHSFRCKVILDNVSVVGSLEDSYQEDSIYAGVAQTIERIEKFRENYL